MSGSQHEVGLHSSYGNSPHQEAPNKGAEANGPLSFKKKGETTDNEGSLNDLGASLVAGRSTSWNQDCREKYQ